MLDAVELFKALSDETRLRIINLLYEKKELCVCDLTAALAITQTKASRHLGVLRKAGALTDRKQAQWVYYSITEGLRQQLLDSLVKKIPRLDVLYQDDLKNLEL